VATPSIGANRRQREVSLGVVERSLGLHISRKLVQRQLGISEQLVERG
jgi:hypothetical protein